MTIFYQEASFILILFLIGIFLCSLLLFVSYTFSVYVLATGKMSTPKNIKNVFCICFYLSFLCIVFCLGIIKFSFLCILLKSLAPDLFFGVVASINKETFLFFLKKFSKELFGHSFKAENHFNTELSIITVKGEKIDTNSEEFLYTHVFNRDTGFVKQNFPDKTLTIKYKAVLYAKIHMLLNNLKNFSDEQDILAILGLIQVLEDIIEGINNSLGENPLEIKAIYPKSLMLNDDTEITFYSREFRKAYIVKEDGVTLKNTFPNEVVVNAYLDFLLTFFEENPEMTKKRNHRILPLDESSEVIHCTKFIHINSKTAKIPKIFLLEPETNKIIDIFVALAKNYNLKK